VTRGGGGGGGVIGWVYFSRRKRKLTSEQMSPEQMSPEQIDAMAGPTKTGFAESSIDVKRAAELFASRS